jgi:hypothetical protein
MKAPPNGDAQGGERPRPRLGIFRTIRSARGRPSDSRPSMTGRNFGRRPSRAEQRAEPEILRVLDAVAGSAHRATPVPRRLVQSRLALLMKRDDRHSSILRVAQVLDSNDARRRPGFVAFTACAAWPDEGPMLRRVTTANATVRSTADPRSRTDDGRDEGCAGTNADRKPRQSATAGKLGEGPSKLCRMFTCLLLATTNGTRAEVSNRATVSHKRPAATALCFKTPACRRILALLVSTCFRLNSDVQTNGLGDGQLVQSRRWAWARTLRLFVRCI